MPVRCIYFLWLAFVLPASVLPRSANKGAQKLVVSSLQQTFSQSEKRASFVGQVDAQVGPHLHMWADQIVASENGQELFARSTTAAPVVIEDNNLLIFADNFRIRLDTKTGEAQGIRLHLRDGFVKAKRARKLNDLDWQLEEIEYTACDRRYPEWSIVAEKAVCRGGYFIRAHHVRFNVGTISVFGVPQFIIPVQFGGGGQKKHAKSGFLLPRFLIDYQYGMGVKQEYYKTLTDRADTTLGIDWRYSKGIILSDELRWYRSEQSFTQAHAHYAVVRDRYVQRGKVIRKGTSKGYWVRGKSFHQVSKLTKAYDAALLMRADFGTDLRMAYHFFTTTDELDDSFFNTLEARLRNMRQQISIVAAGTRVFRNTFVPIQGAERDYLLNSVVLSPAATMPALSKDREDRAHVWYLPHLEANTIFNTLGKRLQVRHDAFCDYVSYRQQEIERLFVDDTLVQRHDQNPHQKVDYVRATYAPHLKADFHSACGVLTPFLKPCVQMVGTQQTAGLPRGEVLAGSLFSRGGYRAYLAGGAAFAFPLAYRRLPQTGATLTLQPKLAWTYVPRFYQGNWYHVDRWDRLYPTNKVQGSVHGSLSRSDWSLDVLACQAYDFEKSSNRFPLYQSLKQAHLMPLQYELSLSKGAFAASMMQEYDWPDFQLLQSELGFNIFLRKLQLGLQYLFQKPRMLSQRAYLSSIPHFLHFHCGVPLSKHATLFYEAQCYAPQRSALFFLDGIKPLIHRVRLEVDGHCWGFFIGFEEKKFKECGIGRNERAMVFSLRLDSLGSFAKKFKRVPQFARPAVA